MRASALPLWRTICVSELICPVLSGHAFVGTDKEGFKVEFEGEKVQVNSAAYGYENAVNSIMASMKLCGGQPKDLVLVVEGLNSKSRRWPMTRLQEQARQAPPEAYAEFGKVKDMLTTVFGKVGALVVEQEEAEADDVLAFLAENSEEDFFIVSRDNDLFTAFRARNKYGASVHVLNDGNFNEHHMVISPHHLIPVYKALVGDSSDSITGIPGFGKKAFEDYFAQFGAEGMQKLYDMGMSGTLNELVPMMDTPIIAKIVRGEADFFVAYLRLPAPLSGSIRCATLCNSVPVCSVAILMMSVLKITRLQLT